MERFFFALSLGFAGVIFLTQTVHAAPQCGPRAAIVDQLAAKYGETRRNIGIAANKTVMETFASAKTGTWTTTITMPDGTTCLAASGENFEPVTEELPANGVPS